MSQADHALAFLKRCSEGNYRIVCTGDLTEFQIAEARVENRVWVSDDGIGFVLLSFELSTPKDKAREQRLSEKTGDVPEAWVGNRFDVLKTQINEDPEYGWSWHCNIAMPILDAGIGVTARMANDAAANVMMHLFRFDSKACKEWQWERGSSQETSDPRYCHDGEPHKWSVTFKGGTCSRCSAIHQ